MALVEIEGLTFGYDADSPARQLVDCSLSIEPGELVLVVGPSGCGKSTLLRAVNGLVPHFHGGVMAGRVRVAGLDTREHTPAELAHSVACVFQDPEAQVITSTGIEEVALGLENLGVVPDKIAFRAHEALGAMGVSHLAERSTRELSGGEMQRVAIAAALAMRPSLLVLDEPTSQLDPTAAESLLELLRRVNEDSGIAVVIAEHRLERCFHWADRVIVMEGGRIASDATPRASAAWSVSHGGQFVPPVARLFAGLGGGALPLTVKEGRARLREIAGAGGVAGAVAREVACAPPPPAPAEPTLALATRGLRFSYGNGFEALRGIDLAIPAGDLVAVMGENGAGKSTLVRHFNGLSRAQSGEVRLLGRDTARVPVEELARTCALLGQNPSDYLFCDTIAEELQFSLTHLRSDLDAVAREEAAQLTLARLGIEELVACEPRALSVGQRQRAAIAAMMVAEPAVLVLDEPTRGLDWASKTVLGECLRTLQRDGTTIVVVTHDVEFAAAFTDHVLVMGSGRLLAQGPTPQVLGSTLFLAPQVSRVLGSSCGVVTVDAGRALLKQLTADE